MKHKLWNVLPEMIMVFSSVVSPFASAKEMSFQEDAWIGDVKITCFSWEFWFVPGVLRFESNLKSALYEL